MAARAVVVLADGFEEIEAVTIIDILRRAGVAVQAAGLQSTTVRGSHGLNFIADEVLSEVADGFDAIVLPGGQPGTNNLMSSGRLMKVLKAAAEAGKLCAAICAAPMVLAKAGLLENRKATCYPGHENQLAGARFTEDPVVVDGNIITSRAVSTAIPFALALVARLCGEKTSQELALKILWK